MAASHTRLVGDLASFHRARQRPKIVFTEIALAGSWGSEGRLDVVTFTSTQQYRKLLLFGYEVKATRADLLADLRAEKWRRYLPWVHRFYFAFPDGLARREEIPEECGVIVRTKRAWKVVRGARTRPGERVGTDTLARLLWRRERECRAEAQGRDLTDRGSLPKMTL